MKTQGFTLIELLAVIVILAIIALIATPIVLGIIDDTKKSAQIRSAEMYLKGVANAVMRENMNTGGNFRPNQCSITSEGNLDCDDKEGILEVEVDGEKPKNGTITFEEGKIKEVTLNYTNSTIVKNDEGNLVYEGSSSNITYESLGNWEHKLSNGTVEAHDTESGTCSKCGETVLAPGLYDAEGNMTKSWEQLITDGDLVVENGSLRGSKQCPEGYGYYSDIEGKLVVDNSVTSIGEFSCSPYMCSSHNSKNITEIVLPSSVTSIGMGAFNGATGLVSINIPEGVTTIDNYTFCGCTSLKSIEIPKSVTSIEPDAFDGCDNLESITVDENNTVYDSRENCNAIIETATNTLIVGSNNTIIPDGVTTIGNHALARRAGLESVNIPHSVTNIGYGVFTGCSNLTTINYDGTKAEWNAIAPDYSFETYTEITIHCTDGDIVIPANN